MLKDLRKYKTAKQWYIIILQLMVGLVLCLLLSRILIMDYDSSQCEMNSPEVVAPHCHPRIMEFHDLLQRQGKLSLPFFAVFVAIFALLLFVSIKTKLVYSLILSIVLLVGPFLTFGLNYYYEDYPSSGYMIFLSCILLILLVPWTRVKAQLC